MACKVPWVESEQPGNVTMESFFVLLHKNVLNRKCWITREELRLAIVILIDATYTRGRRQRNLESLTPIEFEASIRKVM